MLFALFTLTIKIYSAEENDAQLLGYVVVDIRKKLMHPEIKDKTCLINPRYTEFDIIVLVWSPKEQT